MKELRYPVEKAGGSPGATKAVVIRGVEMLGRGRDCRNHYMCQICQD